MFLKSNDGVNIYYDIIGNGPAILLLHGFGDDHSIWNNAGWIEILKNEFTVIVIDIRGCGKSDKPETTESYSIDNHCFDIDQVLKIANDSNPIIWGWSLGATIAMHYTAKKSIKATIACGSYFGLIFSNEFITKALKNTNDQLHKARLNAFNKWPIVLPDQMKNDFLVYSGTNDGNVVIQLKKQREAIQKAKGKLIIFDGLDHAGLINEVNKIEPTVMEFMRNSV
jgi:pimeloyl-ACP methyl ester carboxylesterase